MNSEPTILRPAAFDWTGWRIYLVGGGQALMGRVRVPAGVVDSVAPSGAVVMLGTVDTTPILSPVYEFVTQARQMPNGQVAIARIVLPVLHLGVTEMLAPTGCASFPVDALAPSLRAELAKGVEGADRLILELRAANAGLVTPGRVQ